MVKEKENLVYDSHLILVLPCCCRAVCNAWLLQSYYSVHQTSVTQIRFICWSTKKTNWVLSSMIAKFELINFVLVVYNLFFISYHAYECELSSESFVHKDWYGYDHTIGASNLLKNVTQNITYPSLLQWSLLGYIFVIAKIIFIVLYCRCSTALKWNC